MKYFFKSMPYYEKVQEAVNHCIFTCGRHAGNILFFEVFSKVGTTDTKGLIEAVTSDECYKHIPEST